MSFVMADSKDNQFLYKHNIKTLEEFCKFIAEKSNIDIQHMLTSHCAEGVSLMFSVENNFDDELKNEIKWSSNEDCYIIKVPYALWHQ
jgi:hypothetical protein